MTFSIREIMRRLLRPDHELSCSGPLWRQLLAGLRARGRGVHESGAFLLGDRDPRRARISMFVLYDDLDPQCLDTGIVHFDGRHYGRLWEICSATGLTVVADVHTHPAGSWQSDSDQAHPMIACAGHFALIVPRFAKAPVRLGDVGVHRYLGAKRWETVDSRRFHIGL
jgi:hypothetical protein